MTGEDWSVGRQEKPMWLSAVYLILVSNHSLCTKTKRLLAMVTRHLGCVSVECWKHHDLRPQSSVLSPQDIRDVSQTASSQTSPTWDPERVSRHPLAPGYLPSSALCRILVSVGLETPTTAISILSQHGELAGDPSGMGLSPFSLLCLFHLHRVPAWATLCGVMASPGTPYVLDLAISVPITTFSSFSSSFFPLFPLFP